MSKYVRIEQDQELSRSCSMCSIWKFGQVFLVGLHGIIDLRRPECIAIQRIVQAPFSLLVEQTVRKQHKVLLITPGSVGLRRARKSSAVRIRLV